MGLADRISYLSFIFNLEKVIKEEAQIKYPVLHEKVIHSRLYIFRLFR